MTEVPTVRALAISAPKLSLHTLTGAEDTVGTLEVALAVGYHIARLAETMGVSSRISGGGKSGQADSSNSSDHCRCVFAELVVKACEM